MIKYFMSPSLDFEDFGPNIIWTSLRFKGDGYVGWVWWLGFCSRGARLDRRRITRRKMMADGGKAGGSYDSDTM